MSCNVVWALLVAVLPLVTAVEAPKAPRPRDGRAAAWSGATHITDVPREPAQEFGAAALVMAEHQPAQRPPSRSTRLVPDAFEWIAAVLALVGGALAYLLRAQGPFV